jgi:hypothetical protein
LTASSPATGQSAPAKNQAVPRTPDGKPDFTGVWAGPAFDHKPAAGDTDTPQITRYSPKVYSDLFTPGGKELFYQRWTGDLRHDDPQSVCLPVGFPRVALSPYSQQILQPPGYVVILYEYNHFFRVIPTDGRPHPKDVELTYMGDAVGKWEGDTLVTDTIGLKSWPLEGDEPGRGANGEKINVVLYHSDALHVIERFRRTDASMMAYQITIDDPKIFTKPWTTDWQMRIHPTWAMFEQICEDNNRCMGGTCSASDAQKK